MPIITISGGIKSGKEEIASKLSEKLGYKVIYKEYIFECARKYNIMEEDLIENLDEIPRFWNRLSGIHHRQLIYIKCALIDIIKNDNIIYYGPYGQLLLAGISNVIKIRLETPIENRVGAVLNEQDMSYSSAVDYLKSQDKVQKKLVRILYDREWQDPENFDISFNLRNFTTDTLCDMIVCAAQSPEFQTTPERKKALQNISLESEVKAAIASDDKIWTENIMIKASGNEVSIDGFVKNKEVRNAIIDTVKRVKGVNKCKFNIELKSDPINIKI